MRRPYNRGGKHRRLGLKWGGAPNNGIGWCLLEERSKVGEEVVRGDPAQAALTLAQSKGATEIELYRYRTAERFEQSPVSAGLTLDAHCALIDRTRAMLVDHGIRVTIKDVG